MSYQLKNFGYTINDQFNKVHQSHQYQYLSIKGQMVYTYAKYSVFNTWKMNTLANYVRVKK